MGCHFHNSSPGGWEEKMNLSSHLKELKKLDKTYEITGFQTLDIRQQRTLISQRGETNEVNLMTSWTYCLESFQGSTLGGRTQANLTVSLSWERTVCLWKPWQLEFSMQNARHNRARQRASSGDLQRGPSRSSAENTSAQENTWGWGKNHLKRSRVLFIPQFSNRGQEQKEHSPALTEKGEKNLII